MSLLASILPDAKANVKTLIIGDIHENIDQLDKCLPLIAKAERVVFIGDWFDTFGEHHVAGMCQRLQEYSDQPDKYTLLWGNHDAHYVFKHPWFRCSGYRAITQDLIDRFVKPEDGVWDQFRLWTRVGAFLVSHAGFCPETQRLISDDAHAAALAAAKDNNFHPLWMPGQCVGGPKGAIGGPTWLRWKEDFQPITDPLTTQQIPQIVGHTQHDRVHVRGYNYCIDTGLKSVVWVEGSEVDIVQLG